MWHFFLVNIIVTLASMEFTNKVYDILMQVGDPLACYYTQDIHNYSGSTIDGILV